MLAVVRSFLDLVAAGDCGGATGLFTEDGSYSVSAWRPPVVGHPAIAAELERQQTTFTDFSYEIVSSAEAGSLVFTERIDSMTIGGRPVALHWVGVHEIDAGLIRSARDYYDLTELQSQLT